MPLQGERLPYIGKKGIKPGAQWAPSSRETYSLTFYKDTLKKQTEIFCTKKESCRHTDIKNKENYYRLYKSLTER